MGAMRWFNRDGSIALKIVRIIPMITISLCEQNLARPYIYRYLLPAGSCCFARAIIKKQLNAEVHCAEQNDSGGSHK
jgi:hypothetical protein